MEHIIPLPETVGAHPMKIAVSTVGLLKHSVTYRATGTIILWLLQARSLMKILVQATRPPILQKPLKASVLKDGHCLIKLRLTDKETSQAFPQFWVGITAMVLYTMRLRTGSGGALRHILARVGTTCITMVVAYIPAATAATLGSMCAVSRLHKLIPVYSFYSYWRMKNPTEPRIDNLAYCFELCYYRLKH